MNVAELSAAWPNIAPLQSDSLETESFRQNLRFLVARDYGWLASELFGIEGDLGWGPGNREWDGDFFPPPTDDSWAHMTTFLRTLASVRKDHELLDMLADASRGTWKTIAGKYITSAVNAREASHGGLISFYYGKVAECRNSYTLGAARVYLAMWTQQHKFRLAVAGLVRLLFQPLSKLTVRAETVKRRVGSQFQRICPSVEQVQPCALAIQTVAC